MIRMRRILALVIIGAVSIVIGCSGTSRTPIPLHGNFCGPAHPLIVAPTVEDELRQLSAIRPIDTVDAYCQQHDMCYARNGYFAEDCDNILLAQMKAIRGHMVRTDCQQLVDMISHAIETATVAANVPEVAGAMRDLRNADVQNGFDRLLQVPGSMIVEAGALAQGIVNTAGQSVKFAVANGTYGLLPPDMRPDSEAVALKSQRCDTDVPIRVNIIPTPGPRSTPRGRGPA